MNKTVANILLSQHKYFYAIVLQLREKGNWNFDG